MPTEVLIADRSGRGKLRFVGEQRVWFLDQILTQRFEGIEPGDSVATALLTVHGRMVGFMEFVATADALYCHFESELRETLPGALAHYVFATRVEIDDVTDEMGLVYLVGERWREVAAGIDGIAQSTEVAGAPGGYLWVAPEAVEDTLRSLEKEGAREASEEELESIRIAGGAPRWGREMDTKTFPQEAGIDTFAVHFEKGCYLGQEAMAKIHFRGKVNRRLARLSSQATLDPGAHLLANGEKVGTVTSSSGAESLAIVRHTVEPGTEVEAGEVRAEVVD